MQIGIVGLGRVGANVARRLQCHDHTVVVFDRSQEAVQSLAKAGFSGAMCLEELMEKLEKPRAVWLMVPAGEPTESSVQVSFVVKSFSNAAPLPSG
jgi:6-phosphogluconate dehydrogenase